MFDRRPDCDLARFVRDTVKTGGDAVPPDDLTGKQVYDSLVRAVEPLIVLHRAGVLDKSLDAFIRSGREQLSVSQNAWGRVAQRCHHDLETVLAEKRMALRAPPAVPWWHRLRLFAAGAATGLLVALVVRDGRASP